MIKHAHLKIYQHNAEGSITSRRHTSEMTEKICTIPLLDLKLKVCFFGSEINHLIIKMKRKKKRTDVQSTRTKKCEKYSKIEE